MDFHGEVKGAAYFSVLLQSFVQDGEIVYIATVCPR